MRIGQVILVNSVTHVTAEIIEKKEAEFCKFVKVMTEKMQIVGLIFDIQRLNPDIRTIIRPKEMRRDEIDKLFPDTIERYPTIVSIFLIGYFDSKGNPVQRIPSTPPDIYDDIELMKSDEIERFHRIGNKLVFNYLLTIADSMLPIKDALVNYLADWIRTKFGITFEQELLMREENVQR